MFFHCLWYFLLLCRSSLFFSVFFLCCFVSVVLLSFFDLLLHLLCLSLKVFFLFILKLRILFSLRSIFVHFHPFPKSKKSFQKLNSGTLLHKLTELIITCLRTRPRCLISPKRGEQDCFMGQSFTEIRNFLVQVVHTSSGKFFGQCGDRRLWLSSP